MSAKRSRGGPAASPDDFESTPGPEPKRRRITPNSHGTHAILCILRRTVIAASPRNTILSALPSPALPLQGPSTPPACLHLPPSPSSGHAAPANPRRGLHRRRPGRRCTSRHPANASSPQDNGNFPDVETPQTTTELGSKLIELLKKSRDKENNTVADEFLELPDRDEFPDYYVKTLMPLSINMIQDRLEKYEYNSLEQLEADLKRMVQNAKDYNSTKSRLYEDAERIRKCVSNWMPKYNRAYLRGDYKTYATPIPPELLERARDSSASLSVKSAQDSNPRLKLTRRQSTNPAVNGHSQEIKNKQVDFLDQLSELDGAINFEEKVSRRDYPDYYKVIKKPTAIQDIRAKVERGDIADWEAFAAEVQLIWDNAKEYNTESSEIHALAITLEAWCKKTLRRHGVSAPKQSLAAAATQPSPFTKVSNTNIKLIVRDPAKVATPTSSVAGGAIDSESLRRQKEETSEALVKAGRAASRTAQLNGSTPGPASTVASVRRSQSFDVTEKAQSEATTKAVPETTGFGANPAPPVENGVGVVHVSRTQAPATEFVSPLDIHNRDRGKTKSDGLIDYVLWKINPDKVPNQIWRWAEYCSDEKTQIYSTRFCHSGPENRFIRVEPHMQDKWSTKQEKNLYVSHNGKKVAENPSVPGSYDVELVVGSNNIWVDALCNLDKGEHKPYAGPDNQFNFERMAMRFFVLGPEETRYMSETEKRRLLCNPTW